MKRFILSILVGACIAVAALIPRQLRVLNERLYVECATIIGEAVYTGHTRRIDLQRSDGWLQLTDDKTGQEMIFVNMPCVVIKRGG